MKTTEAKAKEFSSFIERQITGACKIIEKRDSAGKNSPESLHITKGLFKGFSSAVVKKLINEIAPKYKERKGGYTRVIKLGPRKSDGARMAIIELV